MDEEMPPDNNENNQIQEQARVPDQPPEGVPVVQEAWSTKLYEFFLERAANQGQHPRDAPEQMPEADAEGQPQGAPLSLANILAKGKEQLKALGPGYFSEDEVSKSTRTGKKRRKLNSRQSSSSIPPDEERIIDPDAKHPPKPIFEDWRQTASGQVYSDSDSTVARRLAEEEAGDPLVNAALVQAELLKKANRQRGPVEPLPELIPGVAEQREQEEQAL